MYQIHFDEWLTGIYLVAVGEVTDIHVSVTVDVIFQIGKLIHYVWDMITSIISYCVWDRVRSIQQNLMAWCITD